MVLDVRRARDARRQLAEVVAADVVELAAPLELFCERDEVDRVAAFEEAEHRAVDPAVTGVVERIGRENLDRLRDRLALDQHGPEYALLDVDGLGRDAPGLLVEGYDVGALASTPAPARQGVERDAGGGIVDAQGALLGAVLIGHRLRT